MKKFSKWYGAAAKVLTVAAVIWAGRRLSKTSAARLQQLGNRVLLARSFFQATATSGTIHQVEFDFIYLDGDRSPYTKRVAGLWKHESDHPDVLRRVPLYMTAVCDTWGSYDGFERMAMILARSDARRKKSPRTAQEVVATLCKARAATIESSEPAVLGLQEQERLHSAYARAFGFFPQWPPTLRTPATSLS